MAASGPQPNANLAEIEDVVRFLRTKTDAVPLVGIICGSGLSEITKLLDNAVNIPYADIPGFPVAHVQGLSLIHI